MHKTKTVFAKRPILAGVARLADVMAEQLRRGLEVLGPQPQVEPIPVRIKALRSPRR